MTPPHTPLHILVAPLDWGLGHTSRCVPIIRHLLAHGCRVTAAGTEAQQSFYRQTFPAETASGTLRLRMLAGYKVRYAKTGGGFLPRILRQVPRLLQTIRTEHHWLTELVKQEKFDGVISDNRYGLYHPQVPSVILTHQLSPRTGFGAWMDKLVRGFHYRALQKFDACWIVDVAEGEGLSNALAHPPTLPERAQYIGLLSQFVAEDAAMPQRSRTATDPLLVLLSGPEPQRTILSRKLWAQVQTYRGPVFFVEGRPDAARPAQHSELLSSIAHFPLLTAEALTAALRAASTIICRSGYSTLMDLVALQKRAIIIPTPGQTEQEYLARTLVARGLFATARQADFLLPDALAQLDALPHNRQEFSANDFCTFRSVVDNWLASLRQ